MQQRTFFDISCQQRHPNHSEIIGDFSMCVSLYHAIELLENHGIRIFLNYFDKADDGKQCFLTHNPDVMAIVNKLRERYTQSLPAVSDKNFDFGHPKYEVLRKHIIQHFQINKNTRSIIFCEFRESVNLIDRLLQSHQPQIRPGIFVGKFSRSLYLQYNYPT